MMENILLVLVMLSIFLFGFFAVDAWYLFVDKYGKGHEKIPGAGSFTLPCAKKISPKENPGAGRLAPPCEKKASLEQNPGSRKTRKERRNL